jgi:four helix bundle protein
MLLDHERLDAYRVALDFLAFAHKLIEGLPKGHSDLNDQLGRAASSVVLNIAEGTAKLSRADKRRYYLTARGSATESGAVLDVLAKLELIDEAKHRHGRDMLVRIVSMLVKLAQSLEP